jgi:hypothetical protein
MRSLAARTRKAPLSGIWNGESQQLSERHGSGAMHGRAHRHLDGFQIQTATPTAVVKDNLQQPAYFLRDLLLDRLGSFFSSADSVAFTGRA